MKSRNYYLEQLERDAKKKGSWQAKFAYAIYLLAYSPDKQKENIRNQAQAYIAEITTAGIKKVPEFYFEEATKIQKSLKEKPGKIFTPQHSIIYERENYRSPDYLYQYIRLQYELTIVSSGYQDKSDNFKKDYLNKNIKKLKRLLYLDEITDALRVKIYFQLIRTHVELASMQGHRDDFEKAKKYYELILNDKALNSTPKAKRAQEFYDQIQSITNKPVYDFGKHIIGSFDAGRKGNGALFKYIGIFIGNILDIFTLMLLKIADGDIGVQLDQKNEKVAYKNKNNKNNNKSKATYYGVIFENRGVAGVLNILGKSIGKDIVGNLIGGPIGFILGLITYPFFYLDRRYGLKYEDIQTKATSSKLIFAKKVIPIEGKPLSTYAALQEKMMPAGQREEIVPVKPVIIEQNKHSLGEDTFPYGAVFGGGVVKQAPSNLPQHHVDDPFSYFPTGR
jgi:hypothetical protein